MCACTRTLLERPTLYTGRFKSRVYCRETTERPVQANFPLPPPAVKQRRPVLLFTVLGARGTGDRLIPSFPIRTHAFNNTESGAKQKTSPTARTRLKINSNRRHGNLITRPCARVIRLDEIFV